MNETDTESRRLALAWAWIIGLTLGALLLAAVLR